MADVEYPIVLRRGSKIEVAKFRCPIDLTLADVEYIYGYLKAVAIDAPIPADAEAW